MTESDPAARLEAATLREIVEGTASETGERFFDELVRHLARATGCRCAWVTEWLPEPRRLRALSFWVGEDYFGDFEYPIAGTPCAPVIELRDLVLVPDRVVELFHTDESLRELGAVSYMGVPLLDVEGSVLGHLAVLDVRPLTAESARVEAILRIFAGRAAAELRRLRRERALRDGEARLTLMFESAMDAILELDERLTIVRANAAAARVFGLPAAELAGSPLAERLDAAARGRLGYLIAELGRAGCGASSAWIPDGIVGRRGDGGRFPAEATLSRYEWDGRARYTLILRDVNERLAAEERIRALSREAEYLREELSVRGGFAEIVGRSPALLRALADLERVAAGDTTVLILGETGTGKELFARAIHRRSPRRDGPLIIVNCAAVPATLQESEFFGHERGAFTGATQQRPGRFELADGGTIFLDEIGEMSLDLQAKLLRVLQEGEYQPVGSARSVRVDVRVVAATHRDLGRMVREGAFRADLLYRLDVFPVRVPPLRERGDDVLLLAEECAAEWSRRHGRAAPEWTPADRARLRRYDWPGNVRELHNVIERALILADRDGRPDLARALPEPAGEAGSPGAAPVPDAAAIMTEADFEALERANLLRALAASGGKLSGPGGAAALLGMHPNTVASRLKRLGIQRREARPDHEKS